MLSELPGTGFVRVMFEQGCKVEKGEHHMMPIDSIPWFLDWMREVEAAVRADAKAEGVEAAADYLVKRDQFSERTLRLLDELAAEIRAQPIAALGVPEEAEHG